jgi:DNA-binding SARP family transcriptional activator
MQSLSTELAQQCGLGLTGTPVDGGSAVHTSGSPDAGTDRPPELRVRCLGGFSLSIDGREVSFSDVRPRALALLRFLALHVERDVHRERIVEALWPDSTLAAGTRSMHVAISSLRRALELAGLPGARILQRHGDAYRLEVVNGRADVRDLERGLRAASRARSSGDLEGAVAARSAAVDLYRGELFQEDGPAEWVVEERERLRLLVAGAAHELASDCRELGAMKDGATWARRSVQLDAYSDSSWRLLADLHDESGDRAAGASARAKHRSMMRRLEVAPVQAPNRGRRH